MATMEINYNEKRSNAKSIDQMLKEAKLFKEQDDAEFQRQTAKTILHGTIEKIEYKLNHVRDL